VNVSIVAGLEDGATRIAVRDSGRGLPNGQFRRGTGLTNTAERLEKLYGQRHKLAFQNCEDGGLLVTVDVPYHV